MWANTLVHYNTSTGFKLWNLVGEVKLVQGPGNKTIPFHSEDTNYVYEGDGTLEIEAVDCTKHRETQRIILLVCIFAVICIPVSMLTFVYFLEIKSKCGPFFASCRIWLRQRANAGFNLLPPQETPPQV